MHSFRLAACAAALALGLAASPGRAATIFSDNFDSESLGLNYSSFANWTVGSPGTVDLIGNPGFFDFLPGNGRYVDLDGSTGAAGTLTTINSFGPGTYIVEFDLAGSQRGDVNSVNVSFGTNSAGITLGSSTPFTHYSFTWTVSAPSTLIFQHLGGDDRGLLLDNVKISDRSTVVPEPASCALLATGLLAFAGRRLRRRS